MKKSTSLAGLLAVLLAGTLGADVKPAPLFQSRAVLQRDKPVPVWGMADPGEKVTVSLAGQKLTTTAGEDGRWRVELKPMPANAEPATMTISGSNEIKLEDILIGEVWLASGQSNMEWKVRDSYDFDLEQRTARYPQIRHFNVPRKLADAPLHHCPGDWRPATPDHVTGFSAVAYFFSRELNQALGVPIGILHTSYGGSAAQAWVREATLAGDPALAVYQQRWTEAEAGMKQKLEEFKKAELAWQQEKAKAQAEGRSFTAPAPRPPSPLPGNHKPSALYNAMLHPLIPYALRGAIWYQGESNAGLANEYQHLFSSLIQSWRAEFAQGDFPFYWVQLSAFHASNGNGLQWPALREAQTRTLALPHTGQAISVDIGDFDDIHPRNKLAVARRLARLALARAYGDTSLADSGPTFDKAEVLPSEQGKPAAMRVTFQPADRPLRHVEQRLTGFQLAGEDRVFHPAEARINGNTVIVSSSAVPAPVAVRYAWTNSPEATLHDPYSLPVPPFRSDDW